MQKEKASLSVEQKPLTLLVSDPSNLRQHSERNIEAIKSSLVRFGQQKPIVIDSKNVVHAGNGTLEAARQLGWESIACVRSDLSGSDLTAFAIADNRTAELASWDDEALAGMLNGLASIDEDLLISTGFTSGELDKLLADSESIQGGHDLMEEVREVVVSCKDEKQQQELFEKLRSEGWQCRLLTM